MESWHTFSKERSLKARQRPKNGETYTLLAFASVAEAIPTHAEQWPEAKSWLGAWLGEHDCKARKRELHGGKLCMTYLRKLRHFKRTREASLADITAAVGIAL